MWQNRIRRLGAVAAVVGLATIAMPNPAFAAEGPDPAAIDRFVTDYADQAGYPGVVVAITKGDRVVHTAGYGRDSSGAAMTAKTPMPVASVSKSFTALAVMRLVEAGKVALDTPVRHYLPDFQIADPRGVSITVRQLLNQTSGINDRTLPEKSLAQPDSLADAVRRANTTTLAVDPGTKHFYTNTNYHLAARLVEVVAGEPFADHLRRQVFEPLGMRESTAIDRTPRDLPKGLPNGHVYAYGASIPVSEPDRFVAGADGVITTAEDMARWLIAQSSGRLLSPESFKAMHTSSDPRWTYGLGWYATPDGRRNHNGIWFTHTASQMLLPSGYGIAVMSNSGFALTNEGTGLLVDGLATLVEGGAPAVDAPPRLTVDLVLAGFALLSLLLGIRNLRRGHAWVRRFATRPVWVLALRLLPRFVPLVILVLLPYLLGALMSAGRDITHFQLLHYSVALMLWTLVSSVLNVSVAISRVVSLWRLRRENYPVDAGDPHSAAERRSAVL